jgi:uncharacterized iron-regulated membrane protein
MSDDENDYGKVFNSVVWILVAILVSLAVVLFAVGVLVYLPFELLKNWHQRWYMSSTERARRYLECEVRRYGGCVTWER